MITWIETGPGVYEGRSGREKAARVAWMSRSRRWDWVVYGFASPDHDGNVFGHEPECGAAMASAAAAWAEMLAARSLAPVETLAAE